MNHITKFAENFMKLFQLGGETFISWMTNIVPLVLMLLIAMNTLIAFLGEEKVNSLAKISAKNPVSRYMILPFISAFMLGNPMSIKCFTQGNPLLFRNISSCKICYPATLQMVYFRISILGNCLYGWEYTI